MHVRKFTGTWVLVGIFAALLAFVWLANPKTKEEREEESLTLSKAKREDISRVEIAGAKGTIVLEKGDADAWKITQPRELPAEESAVNQVKNAIEELVATDRVWEAPTEADRTTAGLAPAATTVRWKAGDAEGSLEIGKALTKGEKVYVATSRQPGIFAARKFSLEVFDKGLADFRRKKVFEIVRDEVRSITVEAPGREPLFLTRENALAPWVVATPFKGRADRGKANGLITRMSNLRAESFVDEGAKPEGIDGLRGSITLTADGGRTFRLLVGEEKKEKTATGEPTFLARDGDRGQVVVASGPIAEDLKAPFAGWRDASLFDFATDGVKTLTLTLPEGPLVLERNADRMWATKTEPPKLLNAEATALLDALKTATVSEWGADAPAGSAKSKQYGFEAPVISATFDGDAVSGAIAIGVEKEGAVRWVRTSESPEARAVDTSAIVTAATDLAAAAKKPAEAASPSPSASPSPTAAATTDPG